MASIEIIKTRLIDRILATSNQGLLEAIDNILTSPHNAADEVYELTAEQIEMLMMSEEDIKYGRLITQEELDKTDKEWLG
jgi:predicted GNAT family acetyltransferase